MAATIKKGSTGADVTMWQGLLSSAGFPTPLTGVFDDATDQQTRAWQGANGLGVDGIVGPASWSKMTGVAQPAGVDKNAQFGRDALLAAWPKILDEAAQSQYAEVRALGAEGMPNLAELQIAGAMADLESGYGKGSYTNKLTGETKVLNNWGALQAGKPPCDPNKSFEVTDTGPDGEYQHCYALYPTPTAGALALLRQLTIRRPASWAHMKTGDIDAFSLQAHSWTPPLTSLGGGKPPGAKQNLDPITKVPGYFEQPPLTANGRAAGLEKRVAAIANTLKEPIAAKRGGPMPPDVAGGPFDPGPGGGTPGGGLSLSTILGVFIVGSVATALAFPAVGIAALRAGRDAARALGIKV